MAEWAGQQGWDAALQIMVVRPKSRTGIANGSSSSSSGDRGSSGSGETLGELVFVSGAGEAAMAAGRLLGAGAESVVVEPYVAREMLAWSVVVMETEEDGPVTLMPTQVCVRC